MPCILGSLLEWIRYEGRGRSCRKGRCGPVFSGGTRCPNGPHSAGAQVMRLSSKLTVVKLGVVLFQLGGPDSLERIRPFLYNLFCDPDIIDFPFARIARQPLARLIASTRAKHVARHYAKIGGRSPILENTRRQASALEAELRNHLDARVAVAMRYWHPFTEEAIHQMEQHAPDDLV